MKNVKTMYRKLTMMVVLGVLLAVMSCNNLLTPPKGNSTDRDSGSGNVSEDGKVLITIKLFTGSARMVMPDIEQLDWHITAKQGTDNIEATGTYPTYTLELPTTGNWTFTVKGTKENKELFTGTATENVSNITTSISIPLSPGSGMTDGGATGTLSLPIELINVCYMNLTYRINDGEWVKVEFDGSGKVSIFKNDLSVGQHTLDLYFGGGSKFYFCTVAVNIWPGMTSDRWIKTNGEEYINDNGEFIITEEMVNEFVKTMGSVVFVDASVNADEPGTGSIFAPVNSVSTAVDILRQANEGNTQINGTIMVSGATTIDQEIEVKNGETLTVKGTGASITNTTGRVFNITGGSLTLGENITLTGTVTDDNGGAVYVAGGNFIMEGNSIITGSSATGTTASGGAVYVAGGSFTMNGTAIIQDNKATGTNGHACGGGVYVNGTGKFDMADTAIIQRNNASTMDTNSAAGGGGVYVNGGTFTMTGTAKIQGNTTTSTDSVKTPSGGGGVFVIAGGTFTMSGGTIGGTDANEADLGGGVYVGVNTDTSEKGSFTMSGGTINGNTATQNGGGVYVAGGTFTMSDTATIQDNTATTHGGGVHIFSGGTFTMNGGTIGGTAENTAEYGGGVFVSGGIFNMNDGTISGNTVTQSGGGVYVNDGNFTMAGGTIGGTTANTATQNGGGVHVFGGTFTVSGSRLTITGNTAHNVYLANGKTISIGDEGLTGGTIGVTAENVPLGSAVQITNGDVNGAAGIFTSDMSDRAVHSINGNVYMVDTTPGNAPEVAYFDTNGTTNFNTFAQAYAVQATTITLLQDITPTTTTGFTWPITFDWTCTLDLNGYTIDRGLSAATNNGSVIKIEGGTLTIKDSSAAPDGTGGTGTITGGNSSGGGGGIHITDKSGGGIHGSLILESGSIRGNTADSSNGGGVYIASNCTFTMKGGSIGGNTVKNSDGGGVFVHGTFTMENGIITNNSSEQGNGGGVNIGTNGNFTMTDGTIENNTANMTGGGVNIDSDCTFTMRGGTISGNTAAENGGGVYVSGSTSIFILGTLETPSSPVVSGNTKIGGSPNNVYLNDNTVLHIAGKLNETEESGNIGVSMANPIVFTEGWTNSGLLDTTFFFSDDTQYKVEVNADELQLINK